MVLFHLQTGVTPLRIVCQGSVGEVQDTAVLILPATLSLEQVFLLYTLSCNMPHNHKWKLHESDLATKVTIPCLLFCHQNNCEFLSFGSSVTEASVLLDIHSIEMLGPNYAVMLCHTAGKWETWFRDLFFAVSAVALSCWIRVIDSLLIGGVFKISCQNVCDLLVWICGLRRGPSNLNCTLRSSHINLVMLCNDSLWMSLGFPCHS
jgi:hypothetical protein